MTGEEMERAIEFLLNHHAQVSADIEALKEAQKITTANVDSLARQAEADRREMRETIEGLIEEMRDRYNSAIDEMGDGFNKLILANEITAIPSVRLLGSRSLPLSESLLSRRSLRRNALTVLPGRP